MIAVDSVPLKVTAVVPLRFVPEILIVVPTGALVGENDVMVGACAQAGLTQPTHAIANKMRNVRKPCERPS